MDLQTYLILGGYGFSSVMAGFMYRELTKMRAELTQLRLDLATQRGLDLGQEHERRLSRLERIVYASHPYTATTDEP